MRKAYGIVGVSLLLLVLGTGCQNPPTAVHPAFYHWKTSFAPSTEALHLVEQMETERIYLRIFDIDWNEAERAPAPLALLKTRQSLEQLPVDWVPTVFITNRSLTQLAVQEVPAFADKLSDKILEQVKALRLQPVPEVQLDCDWTESTRDIYFRLLAHCRKRMAQEGIQLSATIRLHQLRYPEQTGIPPVDRGMLMYYNMGDVHKWEEPNSILNNAAAAPYLQAAKYKLPLDLALPAFQWGVLFREGEMIRLLSGLAESDLQDPKRFYNMQGGRYEVVQGTFLEGHYLYKGDLLRLETVRLQDLETAVEQLRALNWAGDVYLTFYHLDGVHEIGLDVAALKQLGSQLKNAN